MQNKRRQRRMCWLGIIIALCIGQAGAQVHLSIGGGNRDPERFDDPENFDIKRQGNKHLAFGAGVHICAGNTLARSEGRIAYSKLFFRFPGLHLSGTPVRSPRVRFKGFDSLPGKIK